MMNIKKDDFFSKLIPRPHIVFDPEAFSIIKEIM
jgi:hypothetical protein